MAEENSELEEVREALHSANEEAKRFRLERNDLREELDSLKNDNPWKNRYLQSEAKVKLAEEGIKNTDRVLKLIDLSDVDLDDEGNIKGLDEQFESVKEDFPEIFDPKKRAGDADVANKDAPDREAASHEKLAGQLLKKA